MELSLSITSLFILYLVLVLMGLYLIALGYWQIKVLKGNSMKNPDGSCDDWHREPIYYGMAVADLFVACPTNVIAIILVLFDSVLGFYLLAMVSFWWLWANVMTTATSLRFMQPKLTFVWIVTYPFGALLGLSYIIWSLVHFEQIFKG